METPTNDLILSLESRARSILIIRTLDSIARDLIYIASQREEKRKPMQERVQMYELAVSYILEHPELIPPMFDRKFDVEEISKKLSKGEGVTKAQLDFFNSVVGRSWHHHNKKLTHRIKNHEYTVSERFYDC